jgi:hypothetical protein
MHTLDPAKYGRLLADTLPAVITNESEYDRVVSLMNKLAVVPEDRITPEQERLLNKDLEPALPQPWCDLGSHQRQAQTEQNTDQKAGGVFRSGA